MIMIIFYLFIIYLPFLLYSKTIFTTIYSHFISIFTKQTSEKTYQDQIQQDQIQQDQIQQDQIQQAQIQTDCGNKLQMKHHNGKGLKKNIFNIKKDSITKGEIPKMINKKLSPLYINGSKKIINPTKTNIIALTKTTDNNNSQTLISNTY